MQYLQPDPHEYATKVSELKIGIISAGLSHLGAEEASHSKLVRQQVAGVRDSLQSMGISEANIIEIECPGALEIPSMARALIESRPMDGVIGAALIVNGEIYRHEFVAQTSLDQLMQVSYDTKTPVASSLLTPVAAKSPESQFDFLHAHLFAKGQESAQALIRQILQLQHIQNDV